MCWEHFWAIYTFFNTSAAYICLVELIIIEGVVPGMHLIKWEPEHGQNDAETLKIMYKSCNNKEVMIGKQLGTIWIIEAGSWVMQDYHNELNRGMTEITLLSYPCKIIKLVNEFSCISF
jgi:hypothetical protein